jgi:NTE family protein
MNALVLSAGGMYGAYQAGVWKGIADVFRPDLIVGASIGAVNGWAIAGGCPPDELILRWLRIQNRYRWKVPGGVFHGMLDSSILAGEIRDVFHGYQPQIPYALVITDLLKLRPTIVRDSEITASHLVATTAIVGLFDQVRIGDRFYSDGGLLSALPLWAAAELGATKALAIDVLPAAPGLVAKTFVRAMKVMSPFRPVVPRSLDVVRIMPPALLGSPLEALRWKESNARRWIEAGERAGERAKHSIENCFKRQ